MSKPKMKGWIRLKTRTDKPVVDKNLIYEKDGEMYLNIVLFENTYEDGPDYDILQETTKSQREAGIKGKRIGGMTIYVEQPWSKPDIPLSDEQDSGNNDDLPF